MSNEPESLVLQLLRGIRADIAAVDTKIDALRIDVDMKIEALRIDIDVKIATLARETREQIAGLRRAVVEYHSSVIGHGMLISDLEERVRRVELHLNLPASGSH